MSEAFELFLVRVDVVRRCKDMSTPRTVLVELGPLYPNVSDWMLLPIGSVPVYTAGGSTSEPGTVVTPKKVGEGRRGSLTRAGVDAAPWGMD